MGFAPLPWQYFAALAGMAVAYLVLVEITKSVFYREPVGAPPARTRGADTRIHRRAARFSHHGRLVTRTDVPRLRTKAHS
jgi:Mg2+-importing ATPase